MATLTPDFAFRYPPWRECGHKLHKRGNSPASVQPTSPNGIVSCIGNSDEPDHYD